MPINNNYLQTPNCLREAGAHPIETPCQPNASAHCEYGSYRGELASRQTPEVRPQGEGRRPASILSPDQTLLIEVASCRLFGRFHELTISPLPEFCRTPLTGKLPASRIPNRYFACLPTCSAREHCLESAMGRKPPSSKPELPRSNSI